MSTVIHIIGAGGHAKVVIDALLGGGCTRERLVVRDANPARAEESLMGFPIAAPDIAADIRGALFHVAVGSNVARGRLHAAAEASGARPLTVVHSRSHIASSSIIEDGAFVAAGAVVGPDARVGAGSIINHNTVVDHDCVLGNHCHVAPGAVLGGGVWLGEGAFIGTGASILPGLVIGAHAVIGAGAVVTRPVGGGETWAGVPAALIQE